MSILEKEQGQEILRTRTRREKMKAEKTRARRTRKETVNFLGQYHNEYSLKNFNFYEKEFSITWSSTRRIIIINNNGNSNNNSNNNNNNNNNTFKVKILVKTII